MSLQTFVTKGFIWGIIGLVIFLIWTAGGGATTIFNMGKITAQISGVLVKVPAIAWAGLAVIVVFKMLFGK